MKKIYYDKDADLKYLKDSVVGIIGYGIQGRAQALNIRDSGLKVMIANRGDEYAKQALGDGFRVYDIDKLARIADVILFLIPDQAQSEVYRKSLKGRLRPGSMLVFAHGFALRYKTIDVPSDIDVAMLAPRMPGHQIRNYFLNGSGVPAFADVIQDKTRLAWKRLLSLSRAAGFTRAGVLRVDYKVETELDLFIEQFLVSALVKAIHTSFKVLVEEGHYPAVPVLMELCASGELAEVLKLASKVGIGKVFQKNASPTCQYGIAANFDFAMGPGAAQRAKQIIRDIQDGRFARKLDKAGKAGYSAVRKLWQRVDSPETIRAQEWINKSFKRGKE